MTNEEIILKLNDLENRIRVNEDNIKELKAVQKQLNDLTLSVKELAIGVSNLTSNVDNIQTRVRNIELEPAELNKAVFKQVIITIITVAVTSAVTFFLCK